MPVCPLCPQVLTPLYCVYIRQAEPAQQMLRQLLRPVAAAGGALASSQSSRVSRVALPALAVQGVRHRWVAVDDFKGPEEVRARPLECKGAEAIGPSEHPALLGMAYRVGSGQGIGMGHDGDVHCILSYGRRRRTSSTAWELRMAMRRSRAKG